MRRYCHCHVTASLCAHVISHFLYYQILSVISFNNWYMYIYICILYIYMITYICMYIYWLQRCCTMVPSAGLQQDSLVDLALGFELLSLLVAADATGGREGGDVVRSHILRSTGDGHGKIPWKTRGWAGWVKLWDVQWCSSVHLSKIMGLVTQSQLAQVSCAVGRRWKGKNWGWVKHCETSTADLGTNN